MAHPETMPTGSGSVDATAADPPDPVVQLQTGRSHDIHTQKRARSASQGLTLNPPVAVATHRRSLHAPTPPVACRASIATPTASSAAETKRFIARLDTRWAMRAPNHTPTISSTETAAATVKSIVP